jgi:aryl-alcohol dehydrogenase-like predicted oxidoreductase
MKTTQLGDLHLSQLMLGTVQFGLPYGVANVSGQPSFEDVCAILQCAHEGGVNCLDTAPIYGESEEVLGRALHELKLGDAMCVVSKTLRLVEENASAAEIERMAESEVLRSLERLQLEALPVCLIHVQENFRYVEALQRLKEKGLIRHVGCSVTKPSAAHEIIRSGLCEAVQLPTSILDRRFSHSGIFEEARERGVAIFVRSAYLQGLILMEPDGVPDDLRAVVPALQELRALAAELNLGMEELALRYVLGLRGLSCVVVGVESTAQMRRNLEVFESGALNATVQQHMEALDFDLPDLIFEPWRWQKRMPDASSKQ